MIKKKKLLDIIDDSKGIISYKKNQFLATV